MKWSKDEKTRSYRTVAVFWLALLVVAACRTPGGTQPQPARAADTGATSAVVPPPAELAQALQHLDEGLRQTWRQSGVVASQPADDSTYLRRVYIDLTGAIPPAAVVRSFQQDRRTDKRYRLVAQLSQSPEHFAHMAQVWDQILLGKTKRNPLVDRLAFRRWLYRAFERNMPWDEMVRALVSATGQNSAGGRPRPSDWEDLGRSEDNDPAINAAVNFGLSHFRQPQNLAGATSRIFLGVQIQCAECHDHKTERWTQADFKHFTAAFMQTRLVRIDRGRVMGPRRVELRDVRGTPRWLERRNKRLGYSAEAPRALDGTDLKQSSMSPRKALAAWLTATSNPWFAKAYVNRVWARLLGSGFMNPIDDIRDGQKVIAPHVLEHLSAAFVKSGYDMRWLNRVIVASQAYQRSSGNNGQAWSSFRVRSMSSDQLLDSIARASGIEKGVERLTGERLSRLKLNLRRQFRFLFDVDEEGETDVFGGTMPQALLLQNGAMTTAASSRFEGTTLAKAMQLPDRQAIQLLYESVYGRSPREQDFQQWLSFLQQAEGRYLVSVSPRNVKSGGGRKVMARAYRRSAKTMTARDHALEDLMWALLNSSEFFFIH